MGFSNNKELSLVTMAPSAPARGGGGAGNDFMLGIHCTGSWFSSIFLHWGGI